MIILFDKEPVSTYTFIYFIEHNLFYHDISFDISEITNDKVTTPDEHNHLTVISSETEQENLNYEKTSNPLNNYRKFLMSR